MDIKDKYIDQYTKELVKDAGLESVSPIVLDNIMKTISVSSVSKFSYEPLISKKAWMFILISIVLLFSILFLFPVVDKFYINDWNLLDSFSSRISAPKISIPYGAIYLVPFVIILFVQILYIKGVINHKLQF